MTIATTGQDVADETAAFNQKLSETLAAVPRFWEVDDPVVLRSGSGVFPPPVVLDQGIDRIVHGRAGGVPVRVFTPPKVNGVFMHLHPGGRVLGSARHQDLRLWALAQAAGAAVVAVDYRLAPEHPDPAAVDDCEDVARWLVSNAESEFGTDRLVVGGESAGAELSVHTLLRLREADGQHRAFRAAYLAYGVYDMSQTPSARLAGESSPLASPQTERWFRAQAFPGLTAEELRDPAISPLYADLRDLPPARFVVGTGDLLLDDTLFMAARWQAAGNAAVLEVVAEAMHGFTAFPITVAERELAQQQKFVASAIA